MAVVFLSDVHLSENNEEITTAFTRAIATIAARQPEAVFILGDLFNAWLGDHLGNDFTRRIASELRALSEECPVFYQRGNRDFLIGPRFMAESGMTLLPDRYVFDWQGQRLLLEHGDLLCQDDIGYQRLRKILRHRGFYWLAERTPNWLNAKVGRFLRRQSGKRGKQKPRMVVDVTPAAVCTAVQQFDANLLIHGHTHRPAIHFLEENRQRIVLGDWRPNGEVLFLENHNISLRMLNACSE